MATFQWYPFFMIIRTINWFSLISSTLHLGSPDIWGSFKKGPTSAVLWLVFSTVVENFLKLLTMAFLWPFFQRPSYFLIWQVFPSVYSGLLYSTLLILLYSTPIKYITLLNKCNHTRMVLWCAILVYRNANRHRVRHGYFISAVKYTCISFGRQTI